MKALFITLSALLALMTLPACNMGTVNSGAKTTKSSYSSTVSAMLASDTNGYICSSNVKDPKPQTYDGRGNFTVCRSASDSGQFKISGLTSATNLCVYPMHGTQGTSAYLVETPQCFSVSNPVVKFNSRDINYMVIVDQNYTNQMNSCLSSSSACPTYSEGFVQ